MHVVLITGITGFLGTSVASEMIKTTEDTLYGLVRGSSLTEATNRLMALWRNHPELVQNIGHRIQLILGDITKADLGLTKADEARLIGDTDVIIHTAALTGIRHTKEEFDAVNVDGTRHVLDLAKRIQADHPLVRFAHVSTAYVAGRQKGKIREDSLKDGGFQSLYEQSKYEGESLVAAAGEEMPISIFRPGQIVGDSRDGYVKNFNTLYYPLKLYLRGQLRFFPIKKSMRVNLVPVDYVARCIVRITDRPDTAGKTFHLTANAASMPTVGELMEAVRDWAKEHLSLRLRRPFYFPLPFLGRIGSAYNQSSRASGKKSVLSNLLALSPYFTEDKVFDTTNTEQVMGAYDLNWQTYLPRLLRYAVDRNFLNDNSRTVFEQVRFCLQHQAASITYYDVTDTDMMKSSADSVSARIEQTLCALQALGVGKGSRVALSGINSVSYFILDVAIGLSGAASVPLYYTTPPQELDELLTKSGAGWFFIGDSRILSRVPQMTYPGPMISFTEGADAPKDARLTSWEDFLSLGQDQAIQPVSVSYQDIATIRYTSGTTGRSKSVAFTQGQLRWMAETMSSLLSFKSHTRPAAYLSFLPLSHVVEGILGAYTPYYFGAPASLYFLHDFNQVAEALPKVTPTIFFSIPRFYEKVWDQLQKNRVGQLYLSSQSRMLKKMLRPLLRSILLKQAGLNACDQLIVGSAPVSETLLGHFRDLGIEIHNAYGLTEAPLITLNRLGENDLTTVGPPLPETTVTLAEDGEILVRGPQVAAAYDGRTSEDLHTGDLGVLTEKGHLQIVGRKKEILINSYGKNINLQKVETRLKDLPGISEALLIGEQRPYCVALLWPEEGEPIPDQETLKKDILKANEELSHPEQVKRYALMSSPLKISTGELTPNLKLKRDQIEELHDQTIEGLYAEAAVPAGQVHFIGAL